MRGDEFPIDPFVQSNFEEDSYHLVFANHRHPAVSQVKPDRSLEASSSTLSNEYMNMIFPPVTDSNCGADAWNSTQNGICSQLFDDLLQPVGGAHVEPSSPCFFPSELFSTILPDSEVLTQSIAHTSRQLTPNDDISLSPLHFTHSRSHSTSPDVVQSLNHSAGDGEGTTTDGGQQQEEEMQLTDGGETSASGKIPRHMRPAHKRAEARRRFKIQGGLEKLTNMVPANMETTGGVGKSKKSKATMLRKSADYCRRLIMEHNKMLAEGDALRAEMQALTAEIKHFQDALPAEGMKPMAPGSSIPIEQMFANYTQAQSLSNWKFWIFGRLTHPLFESFNRVVSVSSADTFRQSSIHWMRDYLSLVALRPVLLNGLRELVTSTTIMTNPERLEAEVRTAVMQESGLVALPTSVAAPGIAVATAASTTTLAGAHFVAGRR